MSLYIRNTETHRLAKELAALTGESISAAVDIAIFDRLLQVMKEQGATKADLLMKIAEDSASRIKEPYKSMDVNELLYDDMGLPK